MEVGRIKRFGNPITLEEWQKVVKAMPFLQAVPSRRQVNPFTKEEMIVPGEHQAYFTSDGEKVGAASLEDGEILTDAIPRSIREQIANELGADVRSDDRS